MANCFFRGDHTERSNRDGLTRLQSQGSGDRGRESSVSSRPGGVVCEVISNEGSRARRTAH